MANDFYTAEQAAKTSVELAKQDAFLSALINRDAGSAALEGGGKGRVINVRVPAALIARSRDIDETSAAIVMDNLAESTVPITLGDHIYSAVALSEGDITLNIEDFSGQVLNVQSEAVVERIEEEVAKQLRAIPETTSVAWDPANPVKTFTELRKILRKRGVPATGLNVVVGADVYATLLDAKEITDASQSASSDALREGNVGKLRGFTIVESTRVGDGEIAAFHRDAFTLANRAPVVPAGASFGEVASSGGFSLRYLRDYDVMTTKDRSLVSTFAGVAAMPLYKIVRDYSTNTATVEEVEGGAAIRVNTADVDPGE